MVGMDNVLCMQQFGASLQFTKGQKFSGHAYQLSVTVRSTLSYTGAVVRCEIHTVRSLSHVKLLMYWHTIECAMYFAIVPGLDILQDKIEHTVILCLRRGGCPEHLHGFAFQGNVALKGKSRLPPSK
jgi:hypothetical protein